MRDQLVEKIVLKPLYGDIGQMTGYSDSVVFSFYADVQAYSSTLAERDYGNFQNVTNRMFCDPIQLENDDKIRFENKKFRVISVIKYSRHYEVLLELLKQ